MEDATGREEDEAQEPQQEGKGEVARGIEGFHDVLKKTFENPTAFAMVAVCVPVEGGKAAYNVRFLKKGPISPNLAYVGVMQAAHQVADEEFEWPEGASPMDLLKRAFAQNRPNSE